MKKKIIFVTKALWIGGIETALVNLLNKFDYEKYDVTCLVLKKDLQIAERITNKCRLLVIDRENLVSYKKPYLYPKLYHLTEETANPSTLHKLFMGIIPIVKWIENRLYIHYIKNLLRDEKFDTAIIYSDVVAETTIRAIKAEKYLMFYHHGSMRHVYHDQIAYKKCEKIIAVSDNQAEALKEFVPKYANKITSIHNIVDTKGILKNSEEKIEDKFDSSFFNIVSCGRIAYEKGMDLAVQACAKLVRDGLVNIRWWIVGGGPAGCELKSLIKDLNMQEYVVMVGMKKNPYPYIKRADLYVQPSRIESYGLTIKEAMVLDRNIIATSTHGAREILEENKRDALCEIDAASIALKIKCLMNEKEILKKTNNLKIIEQENKEIIKKIEKLI